MSSQKENLQSCCGSSGAVRLTGKNIDVAIATNESVFINIYNSQWSTEPYIAFRQQFDEVANLVKKAFPRRRKIVMAKVDCHKDIERSQLADFGYCGGNTIVVFRNGQRIKQNYSIPSIKDYVFDELKDSIRILHDREELGNLDAGKHLIIGYFDKEDMPEYDNFRRVAHNLRERCQFYVKYGYSFNYETSTNMRPPNQPTIVFKPGSARSNDNRETFKGCVKNYDDLNLWAHKKCLVRELTLDNFEEFSKERQRMIILFYNPSNHKCVRDFCDIVGKKLMDQNHLINVCTADGVMFGPFLRENGTKKKDLPVIMREDGNFFDFKEFFCPAKLRMILGGYGRRIRHVSLDEYVKSMHKKRKSVPPGS